MTSVSLAEIRRGIEKQQARVANESGLSVAEFQRTLAESDALSADRINDYAIAALSKLSGLSTAEKRRVIRRMERIIK
jgi:hypothetical protein